MKRYKKKFKEEVLTAATEFDTSNPTDQDILRISISSELSAINLYRRLANLTSDDKLKRILLDIAKEEKVHVGEFEAYLRKIDTEDFDSYIKGSTEVEKI